MFKFIPYVLKTLWRHRSRTILTVSGSAVALFVFSFVGSVQKGTNDLERPQALKQSMGMLRCGLPPTKLRRARDFELLSGSWDDFEQHQDAAVVGRAVANRRGLKAG